MTRFPLLRNALVAGAVAIAFCGAPLAHAGVDMFLKLEGVPGESTDERHKGEIDLLAFSWEISPKSGDLVGRTAKVCAHDIAFTKNIDRASPLLASNAVLGTVFPKATLSIRQSGAGQDFMTLELNSVLVSSVNHAASASSNGAEQFTLNLASATFTFRSQKPDGTFTDPVVGLVSRTC